MNNEPEAKTLEEIQKLLEQRPLRRMDPNEERALREEKKSLEEAARNLKIQKVVTVLRELGIEMAVTGCGCYGSPGVTFKYQGETIADNDYDFKFDTTKENGIYTYE